MGVNEYSPAMLSKTPGVFTRLTEVAVRGFGNHLQLHFLSMTFYDYAPGGIFLLQLNLQQRITTQDPPPEGT